MKIHKVKCQWVTPCCYHSPDCAQQHVQSCLWSKSVQPALLVLCASKRLVRTEQKGKQKEQNRSTTLELPHFKSGIITKWIIPHFPHVCPRKSPKRVATHCSEIAYAFSSGSNNKTRKNAPSRLHLLSCAWEIASQFRCEHLQHGYGTSSMALCVVQYT